jgi:hypothetical protein
VNANGMSEKEVLELAFAWINRRVPVGPIAVSWDERKHATSKRPLTTHGHRDFSTDVHVFRRQLNGATRKDGEVLGVGLHLGPRGWVALDVDCKNGANGDDELAELERVNGELPQTPHVSTPSGGEHVWLDKGDVHVGNAQFAPGVDTRGDDGWTVAPGTRTPWGTWAFQHGYSIHDGDPAPAPEWVHERFVVEARPTTERGPQPDAASDEQLAALPESVRARLLAPVAPDRSKEQFAVVAMLVDLGLDDDAVRALMRHNPSSVDRGDVDRHIGLCLDRLRADREDDGDDPKKPPTKSVATVLVDMACARYTFGMSESGEPYATPNVGPLVVAMLRGGKASLRAQLARHYFDRKGKAAPQQALADALLTIEGMALDAEPTRLHLRVARHGGALWLDLGDASGRAVRIVPGSWTVEDRAPVLFRRTALTLPLPEPSREGSLADLWALLNIATEDRSLVAAWEVGALNPDIPHPVLTFSGEQGSGKTTAERVLASIIDPSPAPTRKAPRDSESWVTAALGSWVVGLDNLASVSDWLSDSLCRAVTGEGDVRRRLYTDSDLAVFAFRRCVIVTGIDLGALNGDLADRLLLIELGVIGDAKRREEEDIWPAWGAAHPKILGAVLDLAAGVAGVSHSVPLATKPRMADYARVLAGVDSLKETEGLKRYTTKQGRIAVEALTDDEFVTAIATMLAGRKDGTYMGTSAELLALVTPKEDGWRAPKGWPTTARQVTQRLHRQAAVMRKAGWAVTSGRGRTGVLAWTLTHPEKARNPSLQPPRDPRTAGVAGVAGIESRPTTSEEDDA